MAVQAAQGTFFVNAHQPTVPGDVSRKDRRELALDAADFHPSPLLASGSYAPGSTDPRPLFRFFWGRANHAHQNVRRRPIATYRMVAANVRFQAVAKSSSTADVRREADGRTYHALVRFRAVTEPAG